MAKTVTKTFYGNGTFVPPAGVKYVTVAANAISVNNFGLQPPGDAFFLNSSGQAYGSGSNSVGQLGNGTTTNASSPAAVAGNLVFSQIYTQAYDTYWGLTSSGALYGWGYNSGGASFGSIGDGTNTPRSSPVAVVGGLTFSALYPTWDVDENSYAFGLTTSGALYAWGYNLNGMLGTGNTTSYSSPVAVVGGLTFSTVFQPINQAGWAVFGLTTSGALYAWGVNTYGHLGTGNNTTYSSPVAVVGGLSFVNVIQGTFHTLGLTTSGALYAWGTNTNGQLGTGNTTAFSSPVAVVGGLTFSSIYTGLSSCWGITTSGAAYAWGQNTYGQLGTGTTTSYSSPVAVVGGLTFQKIYNSGTQFTLGLTTSGALYAWGNNSAGQLGTGNTTNYSRPVAVLGGLTFTSAAFGEQSTGVWGLTSSGVLYGWGYNNYGHLGTGSSTSAYSSPVAVVGGQTVLQNTTALAKPIQVVPNTSYSIVLNRSNPSFGAESLGNIGPLGSVTVTYEQ